MSGANDGNSCRNTSWIAAAITGIVVALLLRGADWSWILAILAGLIACVIVGLVLIRLFCTISAAEGAATTAHTSAKAAAAASAESAKAAASAERSKAAADSAAAKATPAAPAMAAPAPAMAAPAPAAEAPEAAAEEPKAAKPKADKPKAPKETVAKPAAPKATDDKPARPAVAKDGTPAELLSEPRDGKADDLKMIKGVGPGIEKTLNEMGIWHYDQIANLRGKEITWVDDRLKFKGRIQRDEWIKQARVLARGGQTEFANRAKKDGTYKKS